MSGSPGADDGSPFAIEWTATALRGIDRMPEKVATAVVELVYGSLAADPLRVGRRLHFELEGSLAARRGPYRVIDRVDIEARLVTIAAVAHRRDAYRPRR